MNEEQFFQSVKSSFDGFSPEVPEHLYAGIQEKMKKKRRAFFLGWSLNTWLLVVGLAGAGSFLLLSGGGDQEAELHKNPDFESANIYLLEKAHRSIEWTSGSNSDQNELDQNEVDEAPISKTMWMASSSQSAKNVNPASTDPGSQTIQSSGSEGVEMNSLNSSIEKGEVLLQDLPTEELEKAKDDLSKNKGKITLPVTVNKVIVEEKESEEQ